MALKEDSLFSDYGFKHIEKASEEAIIEIENRKSGKVKPLKTPWNKFNGYINGGIEEGALYVIGGRPGVGKTALTGRLLFGIFDNNPLEEVIGLHFNFEMRSSRQVIREFSYRTKRTVGELLSPAKPFDSLYDDPFNELNKLKQELSKYNVFFRDIPCGVKYTEEITYKVREKYPNAKIVRMFDHTRLVRREDEGSEAEKLDNLASSSMLIKKETLCSDIFLSQLNKNIESQSRASSMYVPLTTDLYLSDSIAQAADVVAIIQRPEMYNISNYLDNEDTRNLLALHITKNRNGDVLWLPFQHDLSINKIVER